MFGTIMYNYIGSRSTRNRKRRENLSSERNPYGSIIPSLSFEKAYGFTSGGEGDITIRCCGFKMIGRNVNHLFFDQIIFAKGFLLFQADQMPITNYPVG